MVTWDDEGIGASSSAASREPEPGRRKKLQFVKKETALLLCRCQSATRSSLGGLFRSAGALPGAFAGGSLGLFSGCHGVKKRQAWRRIQY